MLRAALEAVSISPYLGGLILLWPGFTAIPVHPLMYFGVAIYSFMTVVSFLPES